MYSALIFHWSSIVIRSSNFPRCAGHTGRSARSTWRAVFGNVYVPQLGALGEITRRICTTAFRRKALGLKNFGLRDHVAYVLEGLPQKLEVAPVQGRLSFSCSAFPRGCISSQSLRSQITGSAHTTLAPPPPHHVPTVPSPPAALPVCLGCLPLPRPRPRGSQEEIFGLVV